MSSIGVPQAKEPQSVTIGEPLTHAMLTGPGSDVPLVIDSREVGSFAWTVLNDRHPALIQRVRDAHPYGPDQNDALDQLLEEIGRWPIRALGEHAHDVGAWHESGQEYYGRSWFDVPFLWAESYFYRRLLDAVDFYTPGPWAHIDPFEPFKTAELNDPSLPADLDAMCTTKPGDSARGNDLLLGATWGNRADLGFRISTPNAADGAAETDLVADDRTRIWSVLDAAPGATISLVADNAGRELLADLLLIDHLLGPAQVRRVDLHLKPAPYYVSDATTSDLVAALRRLMDIPGNPAQIAGRLWTAMRQGRLNVSTHWFHCAPWSYHHMPADLASTFASATLTIFKGDLNYRRLVGDRTWDPTTAFAETTRYFPGPVATLRTLKSDVVTGLDPATVKTLDDTGASWRTNGTHALIQTRP